MGVDIHGWVEVKRLEEWVGVIRIDTFVGKNIHGFGTMFLDEGIDFFQPIAKGRGLPSNLSEEAKLSHPEEDWGHTWAFWHEIAAIDWDVVYTPEAPTVYRYVRNASGDMKWDGYGYRHPIEDLPLVDHTRESEIEIGDTRYRIVPDPPIQRRETLHPGWQIVFDAMKFIASQSWYSDEDVRVVVWFNG